MLNNQTTSKARFKSLEEIFISHFHDKFDFTDFLHFDVSNEIDEFKIKSRTVYQPSKKLKLIQRFLNSYIFEFAAFNSNAVFSYRKGSSILNAVRIHAKNTHFFQTDISNFFNSIKQTHIEDVLSKHLDSVPIRDIHHYKDRLLELITVNGKLPVGFVTSPLISNSCLYPFDEDLYDYCLSNGITYSRYSDDLILSAKDRVSLESIKEVIQRLLNKNFSRSFSLNESKTKYTHKGKKLKFLGVVILPNGQLTIDNKIKRKLEVSIHFYLNDKEKFIDIIGGDSESGIARMSGQLNYISMIDPNYIIKLKKKYGNSTIDMIYNIRTT